MRRMPVNRQCAGKVRHDTEQEAGDARRNVLEQGGAHPDAVRYYPCPHCDGFHLGRINAKQRKRRATSDEGYRSQRQRRRGKRRGAA